MPARTVGRANVNRLTAAAPGAVVHATLESF